MGTVGSSDASDDRFILFTLAEAIDKQLCSSGEMSPRYYCDMIRTFEKRVMVNGNQSVQFMLGGDERRWYKIDDSDVIQQFILQKHLQQDDSTMVQMKVDDGTRYELPLLHHAIGCDKLSLVKELVANGANIEERDEEGRTALHVACCYGLTDIATYLIEQGATATDTDHGGVTPLHWLWMFPDSDMEDIAKVLVGRAGAQLDVLTGKKSRVLNFYFLNMLHTPLHVAVRVGSTQAVTTLLKLHANPNYRPDNSSETPLETAVMYHLPEIVSVLLENGAQLQPSECERRTWALHYIGEYTPPIERYSNICTPNYEHS